MSDRMSEDELLQLINKLNMSSGETTKNQSVTEEASESTDGSIKVENNEITIKNPSKGGKYPVIQAVHPVIIRKNGEIIKDKDTLEESDKIEWSIEDKPMYKIEVSPDKMKVYFRILARERFQWNLKDKEASNDLILEATEDENSVLESIHFSDIILNINKMKITKNLKPSLIYQELQNPTYTSILVAQGIPPTESKDAQLELFFSEAVESAFEEVAGTIDFRNHLRIPSVNKGDIIARKTPAIEGRNGFDVYGNPVKPVPAKDIVIMAREHTEITPDGDVIALKEGRPRITGQSIKCFDISTSYIVSGDVNVKTGNIVFSGDVIVYGNVLDGLIIESLGNVYVSGSVYRAKITSTGSIHVKGNIVACELYSGYFGVVFNRLYLNSKKLFDLLNSLVEAAKLLNSIVEAKGKRLQLGQVLLILMDNKFKDIVPTIRDILTSIANVQNINKNELIELKNKLQILMSPSSIQTIDSLNQIQGIQNSLREIYELIERTQENEVCIDINQCHLSNIKSNGNVLIRKDGVLQSQMYARDHIIFYYKDSVCRGSQLEAGGIIAAMIVGGETGGETQLKAGKRITLRQMNVGRIRIGNHSKEIVEPLENVMIYLNKEGLVFEKDH